MVELLEMLGYCTEIWVRATGDWITFSVDPAVNDTFLKVSGGERDGWAPPFIYYAKYAVGL